MTTQSIQLDAARIGTIGLGLVTSATSDLTKRRASAVRKVERFLRAATILTSHESLTEISRVADSSGGYFYRATYERKALREGSKDAIK